MIARSTGVVISSFETYYDILIQGHGITYQQGQLYNDMLGIRWLDPIMQGIMFVTYIENLQ